MGSSQILHGFIEALVMALFHSSYLFLLFGLVVYVVLHVVRDTPLLRSRIVSLSQAVMVIGFVGMCVYHFPAIDTGDQVVINSGLVQAQEIGSQAVEQETIMRWLAMHQTPIFMIWLTGVLLFLMRVIGGWLYVRSIVKSSLTPSRTLSQVYSSLGEWVHNSKTRIRMSADVASPMMFGFLRPVILVPVQLVTALDKEELSMVIHHELMHVKNNDFVLNLIATASKVFLYWHPVTWYLDQQLDRYREEACDLATVKAFGSELKYAKTLLKVQNLQAKEVTSPQHALALINRKKPFLNRIKTLTNMKSRDRFLGPKLLMSLILLAVASVALHAAIDYKVGETTVEDIAPLEAGMIIAPESKVEMSMSVDTLPQVKRSTMSKIIVNGKSIEIKSEDNEVKSLIIDGKEVPKEDFDKHSDIIEMHGGGSPLIIRADQITIDSDDFPSIGKMDLSQFENLDFPDFSALKMERFENLDSILQGKAFILDSLSDQLHGMSFFLDDNGFRMENFEGFPQGMDFEIGDPRIFFLDGDDFPGMQRELPQDNMDFFSPKRDRNLEELIGQQMNTDGVLIAGRENKIELSGKSLKINGKKQPSYVHKKYLNLFETETGIPLNRKSKLNFSIIGTESKRKYKAF